MSLPREMRAARKLRPTGGTDDAWYYINPASLDVFAEWKEPGGPAHVTSVRFTRRQLEQALAIMDKYGS